MSLHRGMKVRTASGKSAIILDVGGNEVLLKTHRSQYWVNRQSIVKVLDKGRFNVGSKAKMLTYNDTIPVLIISGKNLQKNQVWIKILKGDKEAGYMTGDSFIVGKDELI